MVGYRVASVIGLALELRARVWRLKTTIVVLQQGTELKKQVLSPHMRNQKRRLSYGLIYGQLVS